MATSSRRLEGGLNPCRHGGSGPVIREGVPKSSGTHPYYQLTRRNSRSCHRVVSSLSFCWASANGRRTCGSFAEVVNRTFVKKFFKNGHRDPDTSAHERHGESRSRHPLRHQSQSDCGEIPNPSISRSPTASRVPRPNLSEQETNFPTRRPSPFGHDVLLSKAQPCAT